MPEPRSCQLPTSPALVCIRVEHLDQAETLKPHGADIITTNITKLEG